MEPTELFRIALRQKLKKTGHTQVEIAELLNVKPQRVNDYLGSRVNFSESVRSRIANFFKMTYLDMLLLGQRIYDTENSKKDASQSESILQVDSVDQEHCEIIKQFKEQEKAKEFGECLVILEHYSMPAYDDLFKQAKIAAKAVRSVVKGAEITPQGKPKKKAGNE